MAGVLDDETNVVVTSKVDCSLNITGGRRVDRVAGEVPKSA